MFADLPDLAAGRLTPHDLVDQLVLEVRAAQVLLLTTELPEADRRELAARFQTAKDALRDARELLAPGRLT